MEDEMKKLLLLAFAAICIGIIIPHKVYAVDISVGATTWYAWWDWELSEKIDIDPAFLYGPVLSVKFNNDFNLTLVYLYGKFDASAGKETFKLKRKDADLVLNYSLNDYIKLFVGAKYMSYTFIIPKNPDNDHDGFGPGLGLSSTLPIYENLFLLANISYMHLWGKDKRFEGAGSKKTSDYKEYGINSSLSIAYYIAPASTAINLGGRFQYFKTEYDNDTWKDTYNSKHKFYGITLSATYTFNI